MRIVRSPGPARLVAALCLLVGVGGLYGGGTMVADPSGGLLGMPAEVLRGTPVSDFTLPGLFLISAFGVVPIVIGVRLATTDADRWWRAALSLGVVLLVWMAVQVVLIGLQAPVQVAIIVFASIITVVGSLRVRRLRDADV